MVKKRKKEIAIGEVLSKFNYTKELKKIEVTSLKKELKNLKKIVKKVKIVRKVKEVREYDFNDKRTHTIRFIEIEITLFPADFFEKYALQIISTNEFFDKITVLGEFYHAERYGTKAFNARIIQEDTKRFGKGTKIFKYNFVPLKVLKTPIWIKFYVII